MYNPNNISSMSLIFCIACDGVMSIKSVVSNILTLECTDCGNVETHGNFNPGDLSIVSESGAEIADDEESCVTIKKEV